MKKMIYLLTLSLFIISGSGFATETKDTSKQETAPALQQGTTKPATGEVKSPSIASASTTTTASPAVTAKEEVKKDDCKCGKEIKDEKEVCKVCDEAGLKQPESK